MTREEILNMPAGREMDRIIEKEVYGSDKLPVNYSPSTDLVWAFHTAEDIHAQIVAQGRHEETIVNEDANYLTLTFTGQDWAASFGCIYGDDEWFEPANTHWPLVAHGETAALAICRAALLVVDNA